MKKNIRFLIAGCIFAIASLASIQAYFIYNTYRLIEKEVRNEVKKQLAELIDTEEFIALEDTWEKKIGQFITKYKENRISKKDFTGYFENTADSLSTALTQIMSGKEIYDKYNIGYSCYITSASVVEGGKPETVFSGQLLVLRNNIRSKNEISFSASTWETKISVSEKDKALSKEILKEYNTKVKVQHLYSIENWQRTVLVRMSGLLFFSVVLLIFVVGLFYLSIKNLITQKRISDIKTDFINNITHEFQTPLATMDIAVKTLQRKGTELPSEYFNNTLSVIERQNSRLQTLFGQVAEVSMAPAKQITTGSDSSIGCKDIQEIVDDFKLSHPQIILNCLQVEHNISIRMERAHLNTILVNLLNNAAKYGASQIDIDLFVSGSEFLITVKDDGPGIPPHEQRAIFEKFYRIERGNIHNTKGLGLGLFYVRQVVGYYHGTAAVESAQGEGAMFKISIPLP